MRGKKLNIEIIIKRLRIDRNSNTERLKKKHRMNSIIRNSNDWKLGNNCGSIITEFTKVSPILIITRQNLSKIAVSPGQYDEKKDNVK